MTALSDLLRDAKVEPARAVDRIAASSEHTLDKSVVYRYFEGNHAKNPSEATLKALAYGFELKVTDLRRAAALPAGELGPWTPPAEAGRLSQPVRKALDGLIRALALDGGVEAHMPSNVSRPDFGGYAGPDPALIEAPAADAPGTPPIGQQKRDQQDEDAEQEDT